MVPGRPPIFDERNRDFWLLIRRLLLSLVKEIERQYGLAPPPH
ncbi:MAG: hypothetical protein ACE5FI_17455 [Anaerolineales bacterium]